MKSIAILGASKDRSKFGNKAVRAYKEEGYKVFPVNPKEKEIEGLKCYASVNDIKERVDIMSLYLPANISSHIINDIIVKNPELVYINPGTENDELENALKGHHINVKRECSIVAIGRSPSEFN